MMMLVVSVKESSDFEGCWLTISKEIMYAEVYWWVSCVCVGKLKRVTKI